MEKIIAAAGKNYEILKLLGHGKGGYSYLAKCEGREVVLKQIHHEPCDVRRPGISRRLQRLPVRQG